MVIVMKNDKSLVVSKASRLYQGESCVDKVTFYFPETYEEMDLTEFTATLYYTNQGNIAYVEELTAEDTDKEGFIKYVLPVKTKFTEMAGDITFEISLTNLDQSTSTQYVLHTEELTVTIDKWADYFKYTKDDSLSAMDTKLLEIENEIDKLKTISEVYAEGVPDDLMLTDDTLQLSVDGEAIGEGVQILTPLEDTDDNPGDGILDIDTAKVSSSVDSVSIITL